MPASDATIRDAAAALFADSPAPRRLEQLADDLVARGLDLGGEPEERVQLAFRLDPRFAEVADGMVFVPALVEGTRWTVSVDADHAGEGFVRLDVDLPVLTWWLVAGQVALVGDDGEELGALHTDGLEIDGADTDVVFGPDGWLEDLAGRLACVEVTGGGLRWTRSAEEPAPTSRQLDAVRAGFETAAGTEAYDDIWLDDPVELTFAIDESVMREALVVDREAFVDDPVPRLGALLDAAGLERQRSTVAVRGSDWDRLTVWRVRNRMKWEFGLEDGEAQLLALLIEASDRVLAGDPDALGSDDDERIRQAALLAITLTQSDAVASAFWTERSREIAPTDLARFPDELVEMLGETMPGVAWLRSRCLDAAGRVPEAVVALEEVLPGTDHDLVLIDAAGYAADRGDAATARRLLERAGALDHLRQHGGEFTHSSPDLDLLAEVQPFAQRPKARARRNDPCPCGSGKKYKACHLDREDHPLDRRAVWLYQKAMRYVRRADPDAPVQIADEIARHVRPDAALELAEVPIVIDLALHEGGVFDDFLAGRSELLPDDEALLAAQWALVDRGVFEVERSAPGVLELRDVGRGDRVTVTGVGYDSMPSPGTLLLGRPLPVGDTHRGFGGVFPVPRSAVDGLLDAIDEGDPLAIASVLAATLAPPTMSNTDGEPTVFHELRWRMSGEAEDAATVDGALREEGLHRIEGVEPPSWTLVRDSANQPDTVIATLRLDDGFLVAEVNSDERAEEIGLLVDEVFPEATFVADETRPVEEAMRDHVPPSSPGPGPDVSDPAVREAIDQLMRDHESRWVDEEIPALGGRTPREAVGDPVGREEVEQLIASMPDLGAMGGFGMDPDRIRSLLGLA